MATNHSPSRFWRMLLLILLVGGFFNAGVIFLGGVGLALVILGAMALASLAGIVYELVQASRVATVSRPTIDSAQEQWLEVQGYVKGSAHKTPLSQQDCVYWRLTLQRYRRDGRTRIWKTVTVLESGTDFLALQDDTGQCLLWCDLEFSSNLRRIYEPTDLPDDLTDYFGQWAPSNQTETTPWRVVQEWFERDTVVYASGLMVPNVSADKTPFDQIRVSPVLKVVHEQDLPFRVCWLGSWLLEYETKLRQQWQSLNQHNAQDWDHSGQSMSVIMSDPRGKKLRVAKASDLKPVDRYLRHQRNAALHH